MRQQVPMAPMSRRHSIPVDLASCFKRYWAARQSAGVQRCFRIPLGINDLSRGRLTLAYQEGTIQACTPSPSRAPLLVKCVEMLHQSGNRNSATTTDRSFRLLARVRSRSPSTTPYRPDSPRMTMAAITRLAGGCQASLLSLITLLESKASTTVARPIPTATSIRRPQRMRPTPDP